MKLTEIIFLNDVIQRHRSQGAKVQLIMVRTCNSICVGDVYLTHHSPWLGAVLMIAGELGFSTAAVCPLHQQ